jgi:pimeloyl-ACP methyl ester carboxylesterase
MDIPSARPAVVVSHGLWMRPWMMRLLGARLEARGLAVHYFGYPSVHAGLAQNVAALARLSASIDAPRVHWVGHSLGAVISCEAMRRGALHGDGRMVLLAPPLREGLAIHRLSSFGLGRAFLGRSLPQWIADPATAWKAPNDLGIIAGSRSIGLGTLIAPDLARPNDGAICVADTILPGAREHIVIHRGHSGMLLSRPAAERTADFLWTGSFGVGAEPGA